jgi:hypothetical protein
VAEISSITDAIDIVRDSQAHLRAIYSEKDDEAQMVRYPFPFALWFRGHSRREYELVPSVFRTPSNGTVDPDAWYDETMMIQHVRLRNPDYTQSYGPPFDLLCLLQHYDLPTRILDWTESILIALYFAVEKDDDTDGKIYALNARRLNERGRLHDAATGYICGSSSIDAVVRSTMAMAHRLKDLRYAFEQIKDLDIIEKINAGDTSFRGSGIHLFRRWLDWTLTLADPDYSRLMDLLRHPVAVFPNRLNPRMTSQLSMVLVFGGKVYGPQGHVDADERLPEFDRKRDALERINDALAEDKKFLQEFVVQGGSKQTIRRELRQIGIHEAALFPEPDAVGRFVRWEWTFPNPA